MSADVIVSRGDLWCESTSAKQNTSSVFVCLCVNKLSQSVIGASPLSSTVFGSRLGRLSRFPIWCSFIAQNSGVQSETCFALLTGGQDAGMRHNGSVGVGGVVADDHDRSVRHRSSYLKQTSLFLIEIPDNEIFHD